ncbi:oligopeptide/dipeptide ABC transporter ATP-binding protein, partial [Actinopolyspora mortivallis]
LYARPAHPYTEGLMASIPRLDQKGEQLASIKGLPPNLAAIPAGCPFHPRCHRAQQECREKVPELHELGAGRHSACHFAEELISSD